MSGPLRFLCLLYDFTIFCTFCLGIDLRVSYLSNFSLIEILLFYVLPNKSFLFIILNHDSWFFITTVFRIIFRARFLTVTILPSSLNRLPPHPSLSHVILVHSINRLTFLRYLRLIEDYNNLFINIHIYNILILINTLLCLFSLFKVSKYPFPISSLISLGLVRSTQDFFFILLINPTKTLTSLPDSNCSDIVIKLTHSVCSFYLLVEIFPLVK